MSDVWVRPCATTDLAAIGSVDPQVEAGSARWHHLRDLVEEGRAIVLLAVEVRTEAIAAYVVVEPAGFFGRDFVELLMVGDSWRRRGIGSYLLQEACGHCTTDDVFVSTNESNAPMRALLANNGWSVSGVLLGLDEGDPEWVYFRRRTP